MGQLAIMAADLQLVKSDRLAGDFRSKINLTVKDFSDYFNARRLGNLWLPNGSFHTDYKKRSTYHINLGDLYKIITDWKINSVAMPISEVTAIIAFGSAVRFPNYTEKGYECRRFFIGKKYTKTYRHLIQPRDADFLVITENNIDRNEVLKQISTEINDGYGGYTYLKRGGIHVINVSVQQIIKRVKEGDTVSISALKDGVPIFFDERYASLVSKTNVKKESPRELLWDEDPNNCLQGEIS